MIQMAPEGRISLEPWMHDDIKFYRHQVEGVEKMIYMRSFLLGDEMGLGKTLQTLAVFCYDIIKSKSKKMIVVCPKSLKMNWLEEATKFTRIPTFVLAGSPTKRAEVLERFRDQYGAKILIINYEQVGPYLNQLNQLMFDIAVFDEAHYLKNPKSQRTKNAMRLWSTRTFMVTGSPMLNHVNELYVLLNRISPGEWGSQHKFTQRYCVYGGYEGKQIISAKNENELNARLQAVMVRRKKEDVLDLPKVQYIQKLIELHPKQRKVYTEVLEEMKMTTGNNVEEIGNALTKFLRLKMICGTTAAVLESGEDHSYKLDIAADDARQLLDSGQKVIAFTQFRQVQEAYASRIRGHGVATTDYPIYILNGDVPAEPDGRDPKDPRKKWSRQELIHQWANNPKPGIVIGMFQVAGVGLNMTAAHYGQFLDKLFVPALNQQAVDRMHRIGAGQVPVQIIEYLCSNTIESRVEKILASKKKVFGNVVEKSVWNSQLMNQLLEEEAEAS